MIDLANIQARDPQRAEHERLMAEFLAKGGQIQQLAHIERAPIKPVTFNGSVTPQQQNRKEFLRIEREIAEHGRALALIGLSASEALRQIKKRWAVAMTAPRLEQLAARFGYSYASTERGRP